MLSRIHFLSLTDRAERTRKDYPCFINKQQPALSFLMESGIKGTSSDMRKPSPVLFFKLPLTWYVASNVSEHETHTEVICIIFHGFSGILTLH